jgi:hypothetical protein
VKLSASDNFGSIVEPLAKCLDLLDRVRGVEMINRNVRGREEDRFGVSQTVESVLAVSATQTRFADASKRHGVDEHMDIGLIDCAAAEREVSDERINDAAVLTEHKAGERPGSTLDVLNCLGNRGVRQDRENWPKYFLLHNLV